MPESENTSIFNPSIIKPFLLFFMVIYGIFSIANSALAIEYYNVQNENMKLYEKDLYIMAIVNILLTLLFLIIFIIFYSFDFPNKYFPTYAIFFYIFTIIIFIIIAIISNAINLKIFSKLSCVCPVADKDKKLILCYITYFTYLPNCILILFLFYFYIKKYKKVE